MNNKISHVITTCYLNENGFFFSNLNVLFFELKAKNVEECYVICLLVAS
jgi:hypothetical protein